MYSVTFYFNTKLNAINSVDSPSTLERIAGGVLTVSDCDITHIRGLDHFTVRASYASLKGADYVKVTDGSDVAYFSIIGDIVPTSEDVMVVPVHIDPWLTGGGIASTDFFDGFVTRHHVAKTDDVFGKFTEPDSYMCPSSPLEIVSGNTLFSGTASSHQLIEAALNLGQMGQPGAEALTYTDSTTTKTVTVPKTIPLGSTDRTVITMNIPHGSSTSTSTPVTKYYNADNATAMAGLAKVRDLGSEGSILNSWLIPNEFWGAGSTDANGGVSTISSESRIVDSGLPFQYASVKNQRVLYGMANKYCIQSVASGNIAEFSPESIFHSGDSSPSVAMAADIRPQGKPYFRFEYYLGDTDFFKNCVPGLEWQNAPLVYTQKSGRTIDKVLFMSERAENAEIFGMRQGQQGLAGALQAGQAVANLGFGLAGASAGIQQAAMGRNGVASIADYHSAQRTFAGQAFGGGLDLVGGAVNNFVGYGVNQNVFDIQRKQELRRFNISQTVVTPEIQYPRDEGLRDFIGNGCRVYRFRYAPEDVVKIDKILEAYGYKNTTLLVPSLFSNRSKFNYIEASGISINNPNIPMWLREEMAAQLEAGLRIWHVAPDVSAYTDGTNV